MAPFLRALDLFVSTSEYETFGNSVCEAMACRVPVVAYAGGSVAEVIGDTGAVVATGDLAALTVASRLYASNAAVRTEAAMRGYLRATGDLSPQTSYSRLLAVYDALVEPRNRRNRDLSSVIT
jgi:glycosyltransferase involved in cell wall biosynthesis